MCPSREALQGTVLGFPDAGADVRHAGGATVPVRARDSYLDHVLQRNGEGTGPHLIVVSGDLTETGRPEEYAAAREFLGVLAGHLRPHPDLRSLDRRVLLVGGNHDVDWNQTRGAHGARSRHRAIADAFAPDPRPRLDEPPESGALVVERYADAGLEIMLLGSAEHGGGDRRGHRCPGRSGPGGRSGTGRDTAGPTAAGSSQPARARARKRRGSPPPSRLSVAGSRADRGPPSPRVIAPGDDGRRPVHWAHQRGCGQGRPDRRPGRAGTPRPHA